MNVLFCTQSESLKLFETVREALQELCPVGRSGFILADSMAYLKWLGEKPAFEDAGHVLLKEWEITKDPHSGADMRLLARYEEMLGHDAGLFGAVVADRRLFMGRDCTYTQDYRRRFSDAELMCILQRGIQAVEQMFDVLKPDLVVSFICVTMLDYLTYLFARSRGIRFLNLRPTRVGDRVAFSCLLNDPSPELAQRYHEIRSGQSSDHAHEAAKYLNRVREQHGRYEGVVQPSDRPALRANVGRLSRVSGMASLVKNYWSYHGSIARSDNHVPDPLRSLYFSAVRNPGRARAVRRRLGSVYVKEDELSRMRYVFFPFHTEPEVSLLVYGRPYVNQLELIRMLAMSLPVDMQLVVKEHPWMVGKRSLAYYDKLLEIPRVCLADPKMEARALIRRASLVSVITGSVALEAAMLGKPVLTFGDCPYNLLPPTMVRRCEDPRSLQILVRDILRTYSYEEAALLAYLCAVYDTSVSANLYSVLLGKKGVHVERSAQYPDEARRLAAEVCRQLSLPPVTAATGAAKW